MERRQSMSERKLEIIFTDKGTAVKGVASTTDFLSAISTLIAAFASAETGMGRPTHEIAQLLFETFTAGISGMTNFDGTLMGVPIVGEGER